MDDQAILQLYFERSEAAIVQTNAKYGGYCYSIAYHILTNRKDSEESVNDAYFAAWNAIPPRRPNVLAAFLGRITRNISITRWKSRSAYKRGGEINLALEELGECVAGSCDVEESYSHKETVRAFRAIFGYPSGCRAQNISAPLLVSGQYSGNLRAVRIFREQGEIHAVPNSQAAAWKIGKGGLVVTQLDLLNVIGYAQDAHILDADEIPVKRKIIPFSSKMVRTVAAILAIMIAFGLFLQTPVGVAAMEVVKQRIERFLDILFPPKEQVMYIEGVPETVHVEAQGWKPGVTSPGFSIYVDTEVYTMTEENGAWFIRPILTPENSAELPPVEMEICEIPDKTPAEAAEMVRSELEGKWENLSDVWSYGQPITLCIDASQRNRADALWERHDFKNNVQNGCFHIITRGYMEAAEGPGARFHQMLETFTLIAPQDTSQYADEDDALRKAMQQEVFYGQEREQRSQEAIKNASNQADRNIAAQERNALWQDVHNKLWNALEQTMDDDAFQNLIAEELTWAAEKRLALNEILAEMGEGSLTGFVLHEENAIRTKDRVLVLLSYLEEAGSPELREQEVSPAPEPIVDAFAAAYFCADTNEMKNHLSESYTGEPEVHSSGNEVVHAVKEIYNVFPDMANVGHLNVSVEFRPTSDSDYYNYLSMTLIWENHHWAVETYGLEG